MSIFANTIDGNDIYAKRAEQDKDGNPIRSVPSPGDNEHRGEVLTVNSSDQVVWAPPGGGGGGIPEIPADHASKGYVLGINSDGTLAWKCISNGSGGASPYVG